MGNPYIRGAGSNPPDPAYHGGDNEGKPNAPSLTPSAALAPSAPIADLPRVEKPPQTLDDGGALRRFNGVLPDRRSLDAILSKGSLIEVTVGRATVNANVVDGVIHLDAIDGQKLDTALVRVLADMVQRPVLNDGTTHRPRVVFELHAPMQRPFGPFKRFYLGMLFNGRQVLPRQYVKLEDALDQLIENGAKERGVWFL